MKYITVVSTNHLIVATLHAQLLTSGYKTLILADGARFIPLLLAGSLSHVVCFDVTLPLPTVADIIQIYQHSASIPAGVDVLLIMPDAPPLTPADVSALQQLPIPFFAFPAQLTELLATIDQLSAQYDNKGTP